MNYKRKKRHTKKIVKSKVIRGKAIAGWSYGGAIAREIASRQEFKKEWCL